MVADIPKESVCVCVCVCVCVLSPTEYIFILVFNLAVSVYVSLSGEGLDPQTVQGIGATLPVFTCCSHLHPLHFRHLPWRWPAIGGIGVER